MDDKPPSYSEAVAAIEDERRREQTQNGPILNLEETARSEGCPELKESYVSDRPPAYEEHNFPSSLSPSAPPYSPDDSNNSASDRPRVTPLPHCAYANTTNGTSDALSETVKLEKDESELGATGCVKSEEDVKYDLNLPGPIYFVTNTRIEISEDSPPCTEVRWSAPENISAFKDLIYVAEFKSSCMPMLPSPVFEIWPFDSSKWYTFLQTGTPSFRIFQSSSTLMLGHIKWSWEDLTRSKNGRVYVRIRAVDELNRLQSCRKGPWSEEISIREDKYHQMK